MNWPVMRLADLCEINVGRTPSRANPAFWGSGEPWLSIADMSQGRVIRATKEQITKDAARVGKCVVPGTVLLSFKLSIGKVAIASMPLYTNEAIAALPIKDEQVLDPTFLMHALRGMNLSSGANLAAMGATLNKAKLTQLRIPVPPIDEQRRIASVLDQVDTIRTQRRTSVDYLTKLTASIFFDSFGDPIRNEKRWDLTELGGLGDWHSGATPGRSKAHYFGGDVPWYSSGELGPLYTTGSNEHVTEVALKETSLKRVSAGALMLGMYDTAAFKSSIASDDCTCNQAIAFTRIDSKLADTVYVYFAIQLASERLRRLQRGIRQKNLNLSIVRQIQIPVPPLARQKMFAERVAAIGATEARADEVRVEVDSLFASLQSRAFSGQL